MAILPINQLDSDGEWTTLSQGVEYKVKNGIVFLSINKTVTADTWEDSGYLPIGCRPTNALDTQYFSAISYQDQIGYGGANVRIYGSNGKVQVRANGKTSVYGNVCFAI